MAQDSSYSKQVFIGGWLLYVVMLLFVAIACGCAAAVVDSTQDLYRVVIFFSVLALIIIIIGAFNLTFPM